MGRGDFAEGKPSVIASRQPSSSPRPTLGEKLGVRAADITWLQPWEEAARDLLARAIPAANISADDRDAAVQSALTALTAQPGWQAPIVTWRVEEIQRAHNRLRKLTKHAAIAISPHDPPDILGCYVLLPVGGTR